MNRSIRKNSQGRSVPREAATRASLRHVPYLGTIVPEMGTQPVTGLSSALFGKTRRAILALLFSRPDESFYLRQIVRLVAAGQGGVQREIQRLAGAGIITRVVRGRTAFYQANRNCPVFGELHGLVIKTAGVAEVIARALLPLTDRIDVAFIYGSAAKTRLRAESDIDLFVIGSVTFGDLVEAMSSAQEQLAREVNPSVLGPQEFRRRMHRHDHFVVAVAKEEKVFVIGGQHELDRVEGRRLAGRT
jgi:predicted nucleotidyltransferase